MPAKNGSEARKVEVKIETSRPQRDRVTDALVTWHVNKSNPPSIDMLLARPIDAMEMALFVGAASGRIPKSHADEIGRALRKWRVLYAEPIDAINEICARAMNDRKRGLLKTGRAAHQSNGGRR